MRDDDALYLARCPRRAQNFGIGSGIEAGLVGQRRTNAQFHQDVVEAFGAGRAQTPELNCSDALREAWLLEP